MTNEIKLGVLGWPVKHSLSPIIHAAWLKAYEIRGKYEKIETAPDVLPDTIKRLEKEGYAGVNLTVPHKEAALGQMSDISAEARAIGAVNTVRFKNSQSKGYNTDAYGFIAGLKEKVPRMAPCLKHVVVLGAGGAARAVIYGLLREGAEHLTLLNRTQEKAAALADGEIIRTSSWDEREKALLGATLLVNTTSLGMQGQPRLDLPLDMLPRNAIVADIVYAPQETGLLREAAHRGNTVIGGMGMLLHQAAKAFEIWTGILPDVEVARHAVGSI